MRGNRTIRYFSYFIKNIPQLSNKEKRVLSQRLHGTTLEDIGKEFELTEGRIRQIERSAIAKIKSKVYQMSLFK